MNNLTNNNLHVIFGVAAASLSALAVTLGIFGAKKAADEKVKAYEDISQATMDYEDEKIPTEEEYIKEIKSIKTKRVLKTIGWYAPAAAAEISSVVCIFLGQKQLINKNNMLLDQNSQLTANLAAVAGSLTKQQQVFKDALGDDKYREIANGITEETYEAISDKTGKPLKKRGKVIDKSRIEDSAFIFGPYKANGDANPKWNANMDDNYSYVESIGDYFTELLQRKPVIFRNNVVEYFDDSFEAQTEAGQYFGKTASMRNPDEVAVRLAASDYMMHDPHGKLVDCLLVQTNLTDSVARYLR